MKKILIIEDNENILENTAELLQLTNYNTLTAKNGKDGVEMAIQHKPDLIICDILMPELDGYGVLHAIKKNDSIKNTPFIFLTAQTDRSEQRKGMDLGADDYITKPFSGTELLNAIDSRLRKIESLKKELIPGPGETVNLADPIPCKDELRLFIEDRNINKFKKKQIIYSEGNHPNRLYYLLKGKVKTYKTNDEGKELVTDLFCPGDFLGHIALLEGSIYKDTAACLEEVELAVIPKEDFDNLIKKNCEMANKFIKLLAGNITAKENQLLGMAYSSLRKKVANALLLLQRKYQVKKEEIFSIHISRESLAAIAGTATESFIRTLGDFKTEKLIDLKNGDIIVINRKKLEHLVN